jgi:WXXGXW repeat (2 copies)
MGIIETGFVPGGFNMDGSQIVGKLLILAGALSLTACVVAPYQPAPPPVYRPQPVYQPPPPPAYQPPPQSAPAQDYEGDPNGGDVAETANEAPPPLPDYDQPPCPDDGYLWTPGYWHWSPAGYYWVPGTWVQPPQVGFLWTPGYWAFAGGVYGFHAGYWGPHVGYYGGVNYGFGYVGVGYGGGRWEGNRFAYNTAVVNVNRTVIHNTYNETIVNNVTVNHVSYNGGPNGVRAAPTPQERTWSREQHVPPTPVQVSHVQEANRNPALFAHANGGHPAIAATARPAAFSGPGVISAHGASPVTPQRAPAGAAPLPSNNLGAQAAAARQLQTPAAQPKAYNNRSQQYTPPPRTGAPNSATPSGGNPNSGKPPATGKPASTPHPDKDHEGGRDK